MCCLRDIIIFKPTIVNLARGTNKEATSTISRTKVADSILNLSFLILHQRMKKIFQDKQKIWYKKIVQSQHSFFAISLKNVEKLSAFVAKTN